MKTARLFNPLRILLLMIPVSASAQHISEYFDNIIIRTDTNVYSLKENHLLQNNIDYLYFSYDNPEEVCEVILYPARDKGIEHIELIQSGDFSIIDSILHINDSIYRFKVEFEDLNRSRFLKFLFNISDTSAAHPKLVELNLFPITSTTLSFSPLNDELFIGEGKVFELITNNFDNIKFSKEWKESDGISYRILKTFNQLQLHILPNALGRKTIRLQLSVFQPDLNDQGKPVYKLPPIEYTFNIERSRLQFLNIDKREVTRDDSTRRQGIEIQMDNSRLLRIGKTYRVENQEQPGGTLIAEIFTRNSLTNNRVLCWLRVYNYHRESEGYLYIKDGDQAMFITNFNITPKTSIEQISILRDGRWSQNLTVYPGETIDLKIEGLALHKADFAFEELEEVSTDSVIRSETMADFTFHVPMGVIKRVLNLYNHGTNTGYSLSVKEYQKPRPFDFFKINFDGTQRRISDLQGTILVDKTIQDIIFYGDKNIIDSKDLLYGKQYLNLEITITGRKNELIEMKTIDDIVVCPGINSPRAEFYSDKDCNLEHFNLNRYLRKQTYGLDIWSTIIIKLSHDKDKYQGEGFTREFDLVLQKKYSFDIEVSFPAGLITVSKPDPDSEDDRLGQLSGISIAMIAQFTFYHPEKINTPRPYKAGAGFLALNTFNFSDNSDDRDIGLVVLGSLYPTTKDVKLTFPLYFGGGYLLKGQKFFFLLGPGIRIRL
jgi:hypothetical protein